MNELLPTWSLFFSPIEHFFPPPTLSLGKFPVPWSHHDTIPLPHFHGRGIFIHSLNRASPNTATTTLLYLDKVVLILISFSFTLQIKGTVLGTHMHLSYAQFGTILVSIRHWTPILPVHQSVTCAPSYSCTQLESIIILTAHPYSDFTFTQAVSDTSLLFPD